MVVEVEEGRIRRIEPLEANRATPEGVCLKGLSYTERVHSPDRILYPLARKGERSGAGTEADFERISWEEAFERIAGKLEEIRADGDPRSVLYYAASGTKGLLNAVGSNFWRLYGGCTTTFGDLCWPAGLEATRLTLGDNKHSAPWDLPNARTIVMWGKNAAETNLHQMPFVEQAVEAGGRLIVIDPRRTQTAEGAELLIQPRPGTDGALALAVAQQLIAENRTDRDFIDAHVHGFIEFAEYVRELTPEWAAPITDVPVAQIRALAEALGADGPLSICPGFGMQRYTNSGQTMRAMLALLAITGNIGKPGAGWIYANLQTQVFDEVKDPIALYPPERADGPTRVSISTARLGRDMLAAAAPALRMAWVERGNPITQNPETNLVHEAFRKLEMVVVVDQFMTDTAREADLILPAKSMFEQSDVIGAYWHPYIQLKQKAIEPPGEVKPESEIYWLLARRLGLGEALPEDGMEALIPSPSDEAVEAYLEAKLAPFPELSLERLAEGPILAPGHQEIAFSDMVFPTPTGKIELLSEEARARWGADPLPSWSESAESVGPRHSGGPRGGWRAEGGGPGAGQRAEGGGPEAGQRTEEGLGGGEPGPAPLAGRYPLYFMTPNTKNRIHSQFNNLRMIRQFSERPLLQIHPADAGARDIADGDRVRIVNDRGSLTTEARLDPGIKTGCVAMTNGWWISDGGTVNFLSQGRETDMGHGAAFHDNLVQVEAAEVERPEDDPLPGRRSP